jgi:hypothetical protein
MRSYYPIWDTSPFIRHKGLESAISDFDPSLHKESLLCARSKNNVPLHHALFILNVLVEISEGYQEAIAYRYCEP